MSAVPAYNEESVIRGVIDNIPLSVKLNGSRCDLEVVVVDDFSSDDTCQEVRSCKRGRIKLVQHLINTGAGGATRTGLRYASILGCDYAVAIDGDGQHDFSDAIKCIEFAIKTKSDLIVGNRLSDSGDMPGYKIVGNYMMSKLTALILGVYVPDSQCGLRVYSKEATNSLGWSENGYIFCSEMLLSAKKLGMEIESCDIRAIYTDYSKSKGQSSWNAIGMIKSIISIRMFGGYGLR
jgi:glycosyltransferase involved in cell wall biosynthesis